MDDLISRQAAIRAVLDKENHDVDYHDTEFAFNDALIVATNAISDVPSAQKKGHWLYPTDIKGFCRCECCGALWGRDLYENLFFKYCPRCGSDMRGEDDG